MVILEAPGETWNIKTSNGLYYTLFIEVVSDFIREHQAIMQKSMAFRRSEHDDTVKTSYHDIDLFASGKEIVSDTDLWTQYGDSGISITRKEKNDVLEIAGEICPAKVPLRIFKPNNQGPYD
jgi:hypothetical protein